MYCSKCGKETPNGNEFCTCGTKAGAGGETNHNPRPQKVRMESKTFTIPGLARKDGGVTAKEVSDWLALNPNISRVTLALHITYGQPYRVTVNCDIADRPVGYTFGLDYVKFDFNPFKRLGTSPDRVVNSWSRANPGKQLVYHRIVSTKDVPVESWFLYKQRS